MLLLLTFILCERTTFMFFIEIKESAIMKKAYFDLIFFWFLLARVSIKLFSAWSAEPYFILSHDISKALVWRNLIPVILYHNLHWFWWHRVIILYKRRILCVFDNSITLCVLMCVRCSCMFNLHSCVLHVFSDYLQFYSTRNSCWILFTPS